jgi:hypothetical protein
MVKYTFVHPTKSGGTSVHNYFADHYKDYINNVGHGGSCKNDNNSIIIVRDVRSRFLSMYKYWRNGSEKWKLPEELKNKRKHSSILYFINLIKKNIKTELYHSAIWEQHFDNTTAWINKDTDYKNIIIIRYEENLNDKVQTLINKLGIPNKNIPLLGLNVSLPVENEEELKSKEVQEFLSEYFKNDIDFIHKIETNPELFKLVI